MNNRQIRESSRVSTPERWRARAVHAYTDTGAIVAVLTTLAALACVRIGYVYPTRTRVLRGRTVGLCPVRGVMMVAMSARVPAVPRGLLIGSLAFPVYDTALSLVRHARRGRVS